MSDKDQFLNDYKDCNGAKSKHKQDSPTELYNSVLPETASCSSSLDVSENFHLNVAAHGGYLSNYDTTNEDYLSYGGKANPSDTLPHIDDFGHLNLDDISNLLQDDGGTLDISKYLSGFDNDFDPYHKGQFWFENYGRSRTNESSQDSQDQRHLFFNYDTTNSSAENLEEGHIIYPSDPLSYHHGYSGIPHPSDHHGYSVIPQSSDQMVPGLASSESHNNSEPPSLFPMTQPSDFSDPSGVHQHGTASSSNTSRKGYTHRHQRIYGLSEEGQKKRNQELNNEASRIYRHRRSNKGKEIEGEVEVQEARRKKLMKQYQQLLRKKQLLQDALGIVQPS